MGSNDDLSINDLTLKTAMLLALTRPSRSADLANLITFRPTKLAKQFRQSKAMADFLSQLSKQ